MDSQLSCELKCSHCSSWFKSPVQFGYPEAFFDMAREVTTTNCPMCGNRTVYKKNDMRFMRRNNDGSLSVMEGRFMI